MNRKKLFIRLAVLVIVVFLINTLSFKFYWYSSMWWFDMFMHFLAGFWLSLCIIWLLKLENFSFKNILKIILFVLIIGLLWEMYEFYVDDNIARNGISTLDSTSDLFFDLAGGFSAILYVTKRFMNKTDIAV